MLSQAGSLASLSESAASAGPTSYIEALTDCGRLPLVGPETTPEAHDLVLRLLDIESTVERERLAGPSPAFC